MKIVLTNDDGIDAPGIKALGEAISGEKIWIAPEKEYSQCGHQVTTNQGIKVEKRSEIEYAIGGTPADCIRLAVSHLCPDLSWVISGINSGEIWGLMFIFLGRWRQLGKQQFKEFGDSFIPIS